MWSERFDESSYCRRIIARMVERSGLLEATMARCVLRFLSLATISTALLICSGEARAQNTGSSIGGMVLDTSNRPLSNLQVELLDEVEMTVKRTRTDSSGRYLFTGLTRGSFYVRILTYGTNFVSQTLRVSVSPVSAVSGSGKVHEEQNFILKTVEEEKTGKIIKPAIVFSQDVPEEARKHYDEGVERLNGRAINEGVEELRKAIAIFPTFYLALERL